MTKHNPLVASKHGPSCRRGGGVPLPLLVVVVGLRIKVGIGSCTGSRPESRSRSSGRIGAAAEGKVAAQGRAIAGVGGHGSDASETSRARVLLDNSASEGVDGGDPTER